MMRSVSIFVQTFMAVALVYSLSACSSDDLSDKGTADTNGKHTVRMELVGGVVGFDWASADVRTRADNSSWSEGDKIYLTFYNGTATIQGVATYSSTSGWSVSHDGFLPTGSEMKCEARFFVNATSSSSSSVSLDSNTEIYEALDGMYSYTDGSLVVNAFLSPKTGRIRFTGSSGTDVGLTGITVYKSYNPATNIFTTSDAMISSTVASTGSTPYIYGYFTDNERKICAICSDYAFTRMCTGSMLNVGKSGHMAIPTESSHNGWVNGLYVKAAGVEIAMLPVKGGTFTMGATSEQGSDAISDESPTHQVTLSSFMIGKYEVTQALWTAVMGSNPSSFSGDDLPVEKVSWTDCKTFITKLNSLTGLNFRLPTEAEWEYAARGGNMSQGYKYSGSDNIADVAWYSSNSSSTTHAVGTKQPNELGLYDMSGNVYEWCSDWYGSYSSSSQTNPTGVTSGSYHVLRGGGWVDDDNSCRVSRRDYCSPGFTSNSLGLRLVLLFA